MNQSYLDTARLLTKIAPIVLRGDTFALKGGTAINLFVRDMPRLSVDLDLVFTDYQPDRDTAIEQIKHTLQGAAMELRRLGFQVEQGGDATLDTKLFVKRDGIRVKVEVNKIMRGTVRPVRTISLTPRASKILLADIEVPVVSIDDIYGSKLVAALDRQHPRDLFDVMELLSHEGITPRIRRAFVIYLASHNYPVHEVLNPTLKDIEHGFQANFVGMTEQPVEIAALLDARRCMIDTLQRELDTSERSFLLSLVKAAPDWALLDVPHVEQLPAIKWKLKNLELLRSADPKKFAEQHDELAKLL